MIENTTLQARAEWPITPHRVRKRRDSRVAYHHTAKYFHRNIPVPSTSVSPPTNSASRPSIQIHQQSFPGQSSHLDQLNSWNFQSSPGENQPFDQTARQDGQVDVPWPSMISYNYPSFPPNSPHSPNNNAGSPLAGQAQLSNYELEMSWDGPFQNGSNFNPHMDSGSMSDSNKSSFGSFDSMNVSDPSTMASSISENYIELPGPGTGLDSPGGKIQMQDLSLSDGFRYATMSNIDPSSASPRNSISPTSPLYSEPFPFENDFSSAIPDWNIVRDTSVFGNESGQWSVATIMQPQQMPDFQFEQTPASLQIPWNSEITSFDENADAGGVAFEPPRGRTYATYLAGQEFLDTRQRDVTPQTAVSTVGDDSDYEGGWQKINFPSYPNSSVPSHGSPHSEGSPYSIIDTPHQTPSPRAQHNDHQHVFTAYPGIMKAPQKLPRGRQRALTTKEKKEAREVREAKACWACHLSKIKCSPCSPGSPCKKCAELMGKRRFCLLPCFNDPLESLYTFMVPDYLMGHFTKANVEQFVRKNATGWGSYEIQIQMMWGYWKPLVAKVVTLEIPSGSQIGFQHQTAPNGTRRPALVRKTSPPVGIPLAAMDDMQDEYRVLVHNIVHDDLLNYLSIAYDDQESDLAERLLTTIGNFYCASKVSGNECELLRQALEIHVTSTILERSLILDEESKYKVESVLHQTYPKRSAARCVQRQVKLAFFEVQRKRIVKVLEAWGSMMWTSNKSTTSDKKWAISFSVFLSLILVIDKTLGQAYYFCEGRIANHGYESRSERRTFQELVRFTQAELFERCKEIFHSSFKTRKNGKEACNPIRDGMGAFKNRDVDKPIERFVDELRGIAQEFGREIKSHRSALPEPGEDDKPYLDAGRLSCIFLDDFLDH